jgi:hypothetical protein
MHVAQFCSNVYPQCTRVTIDRCVHHAVTANRPGLAPLAPGPLERGRVLVVSLLHPSRFAPASLSSLRLTFPTVPWSCSPLLPRSPSTLMLALPLFMIPFEKMKMSHIWQAPPFPTPPSSLSTLVHSFLSNSHFTFCLWSTLFSHHH